MTSAPPTLMYMPKTVQLWSSCRDGIVDAVAPGLLAVGVFTEDVTRWGVGDHHIHLLRDLECMTFLPVVSERLGVVP